MRSALVRWKDYLRCTRALVSWLFVVAATAAASDFHVLDETKSPDGRYAVAWQVKGNNNLPASEAEPEDIANYVVDQKANRIVASLKSGWWEENDRRPNHRSFYVQWSRDSRVVAVLYTLRWGDLGSFEAIHILDGKLRARLDLGNAVDAPLRHYLAKTWDQYPKLKGSVAPLYGELNPVSPAGIWTARLSAGTPGDKSGESYSGDATLRFKLTAASRDLRFSVVSIAEPSAPEVTPAAAADAADKHLNRAYDALRQKLNGAEREALTIEQRNWLKERDGKRDSAARTEFVEARAAELERGTPFTAHPDGALEDERLKGAWRLSANDKDFGVDLEFLANGTFRYYSDNLNEHGRWWLDGTTLTLNCVDWDVPTRVYEQRGNVFENTTSGTKWTLRIKPGGE